MVTPYKYRNGLRDSTNSGIDVGQELQTSYGSHSNDVLLCECTFSFIQYADEDQVSKILAY